MATDWVAKGPGIEGLDEVIEEVERWAAATADRPGGAFHQADLGEESTPSDRP